MSINICRFAAQCCQYISLVFILPSAALAVQPVSYQWTGAELKLELGSESGSNNSRKLFPDKNGQIYLTLPDIHLRLEQFPLLTLKFNTITSSAKLFLIWQTDGDGKFHQMPIHNGRSLRVALPMANDPDWHGRVDSLGIGINSPPGRAVSLDFVRLGNSTIVDQLYALSDEWGSLKPWRPSSINWYSGTLNFNQGVHPATFFAGCVGSFLALYIIFQLMKRRPVRLPALACIALTGWLLLDVFWQIRLGRQLQQTWETFAGKNLQQKLLVSEDRHIVQFIQEAKKQIRDPKARVFLESAADYNAMRGAYYMAPVNTYWHRKGPALPARTHLVKGDYLVLLSPSAVQYQADTRSIRFPGEADLPVEVLLSHPMGTLLRVTR